MTNLNTPNGFAPRPLTRWNRYYIPQSDTNLYRAGDVVRSGGGTDVAGVVTVVPHPGSSVAMRGVIVSVDPGLPATGGLQSNGQKLIVPAIKTRDYYVWVDDEPSGVYVAIDDGLTPANLIAANVGTFVNFTPGTVGTPNGGSTAALTSSTFGGAAGAGCFKVLGLLPGSGYGANAAWLVQSANHELSTGQPPGAGSGITAIAQASDYNTAQLPAQAAAITAAANAAAAAATAASTAQTTATNAGTAAAAAQTTATNAATAASTAQTTATNAATAASGAASTATSAATAAAAAAAKAQTFAMSFNLATVTDGTLVTVPVPFGLSITSVIAECAAGSTTLTTKIAGTAVTGTPVSVTTTKSSQNYSAGNAAAAGQDITFVAGSSSSCTGLAVTATYTRTLS